MMLSLLLAMDFPVRPSAVESECTRALPLVVGQPPSEDLVEPALYTVSCSAVAVPTSQVAYLLEVEVWAQGQLILEEPEGQPIWPWVVVGLSGFALGVLATQ